MYLYPQTEKRVRDYRSINAKIPTVDPPIRRGKTVGIFNAAFIEPGKFMRHAPLKQNYEIESRFLLNVQPEHINHIHIGTAEADLAVAGSGRCAAVAENIDVRKGNVHSHGTELATLCIIVESISDLMTTVTAAGSDSVHQGDFDFWLTHNTTSKT